MWRLPGWRKPDVDSLHRGAQNSYRSTYCYSPAPGWLMPSRLLAAQQAGRGEPPGPQVGIPFSPLFPAAPWGSALAPCRQEQGRDPAAQTTSCQPIAARSNGTQHRGPGSVLGAQPPAQAAPARCRQLAARPSEAAVGCAASRGPAHPISPPCWCCAGYAETPMHAVTNGRNKLLMCMALLRPQNAAFHPKKLLSAPACTATLGKRSPDCCPRFCQELHPIVGTARRQARRQLGSQDRRHRQPQAAQGCLTL